MLTFRQIEVFTSVMRARSLSGAAREMKISQPTVTRMILRIEDQLGYRLLDRQNCRLLATQEAHRFLAEIDRSFETMRSAIDRAAISSQPGRAVFRIGASPSVGRSLVPEALKAVVDTFPDLSLRLDILSVSQVIDYLTLPRGDAVVTLFPVLHHDVSSTQVGQGVPVLLMPAGCPATSLADIAALPTPFIVFEPRSVHGEVMAAMLDAARIKPERTHLVLFAETAIALVEAGLGVTIADEFSARSADPTRVRIHMLETGLRFPVYLHRALKRGPGVVVDTFELALSKALGGAA